MAGKGRSPREMGGVVKMKIVRGDTVMVRRGKDKQRRGLVKAVFPREGTAIVEGINMVKRHQKSNTTGVKAGIIDKEMSIPLCALMVIDPQTNLPTRVRRVRRDGRSERISVRSGAVIPSPREGSF